MIRHLILLITIIAFKKEIYTLALPINFFRINYKSKSRPHPLHYNCLLRKRELHFDFVTPAKSHISCKQ